MARIVGVVRRALGRRRHDGATAAEAEHRVRLKQLASECDREPAVGEFPQPAAVGELVHLPVQ
ncbi:hypothetical protein [Catenulispora rubra]|uniref:hypothetical protein n=1 Tax=Catenulispora rubra TaxID=280293 RepID=UPI00189228AF|nr:hypothetical protein [Catenulispora rubra]